MTEAVKVVKMHELLAVVETIKGQATKTRTELMGTFNNKRHHFEETRKTYKSLAEGEPAKVEEQKEIQSTIAGEIDWIYPKLISMFDVGYQIDEGNMHAKADVMIDGTVILANVPATALLRFSHYIEEVTALVKSIPTLDPAKGFKPDPDKGKGIFVARDVEKNRTKKDKKVLTLAPATDKHAAQAQLIDVDTVTGTIVEQEWSGLITTAMKADLLDRCEELTRAFQRARSKANEFAVDPQGFKAGKKFLDYIFAPLLQGGSDAVKKTA